MTKRILIPAFLLMFLFILILPTFAAQDPEDDNWCVTCKGWWMDDDYCFDCDHCINDCTCCSSVGHKYGSWYVVTSATCTESGQIRRDCNNCDYYELTTSLPKGHDYVDCVCTRCNDVSHAWSDADIAATCTTDGRHRQICDNCGAEELGESIPALGHTFVSGSCSECGASDPNYDPCANGHNYVDCVCTRCNDVSHAWTDAIIQPTCTTDGSHRLICDNCGAEQLRNTIPATGHSYGDWTIVTQPTETTTGQKNRTCTLCGYVERVVIDKLAHVHKYVVPPSGATLTERTKATCTAKATYWKACSCGEVSSTEYFEAGDFAEHTYLIGEINPSDILPTCQHTGQETKTCTVCNQTTTRILPKIDHIWNEPVEGVFQCTMCNIIKSENANEDESGNIVYGVINGLFDGFTSMYDRVTSGIAVNGISLETAIATVLVFVVVIVGIIFVLKVVL